MSESMQQTADRMGLTIQSEFPPGSIGYEWDCADAIADTQPEPQRSEFKAQVQASRDQMATARKRNIETMMGYPSGHLD